MADLTYEILTDREKFKDDMEMTLADGQKVTIKQFRDSMLPKGDFTKVTEAAARKERELQSAVEGLQAQLSRAIEDAKAKGEIQPAKTAGEITDEDLENDPVLGRLVKRLKAAEESRTAHEARLKQHEETWMRNHYTGQLAQITQHHNGKFNPDGKGEAFDQGKFLDWVKEHPVTINGQVDLAASYALYSRDTEMEHVRREAEARGVEKGKASAKIPAIPFGRRPAAKRPEGLPESLDQLNVDEIAANDPEVQEWARADSEK